MVLGFIVRCGIMGGAVYYSRELGVWGSSQQTENLYNDIKDRLRPHAKELERKMPFDVPAMPTSGELRYLAKHYYNNGVKGTFKFIEMIPCYTGQLMNKVKVEFQKFSQAPPAAGTTNDNTKSK